MLLLYYSSFQNGLTCCSTPNGFDFMITNVMYGIAIFVAFIKENIWEITEKLRKILISNSCNSKNIIARAMEFCMNIPCVLDFTFQ